MVSQDPAPRSVPLRQTRRRRSGSRQPRRLHLVCARPDPILRALRPEPHGQVVATPCSAEFRTSRDRYTLAAPLFISLPSSSKTRRPPEGFDVLAGITLSLGRPLTAWFLCAVI